MTPDGALGGAWIPFGLMNSIQFVGQKNSISTQKTRRTDMEIQMAKHEIKTNGKRGEDWAKAILNLNLTENGLEVNVSLRHGPDPTQQVNGYLADYVYQQIRDWLDSMIPVMRITYVNFPAPSINGQWPTLDPLIHSVDRMGVEVRRRDEV
jgi:hypothetical protein